MTRPSHVAVDLAAIAHNAALLTEEAGGAQLCAVVKADGYGHGSVAAARAALSGGASMLGVASVEEALTLRKAGVDAPIMALGPQPADSTHDAVRHDVQLVVCSATDIAHAGQAASAAGRPARLHLKVDTGMRRVGADPADAVPLLRTIRTTPGVEAEGVCTHFARADEPGVVTTDEQLERFVELVAELTSQGLRPPVVHAANSAATLAHAATRFDLVRCGIALYGLAPSPELADVPSVRRLRPALRVLSAVSFVKEVPAGQGVSYGHRFVTGRPSVLATVPIGYGDGVPRRLGLTGGEALVGGVRRPIAGVVTMDQLVLDCTDGSPVRVGDEVVLLGAQRGGAADAGDAIGAWEWADRLDTIAYEIVTCLGPRLPRRHAEVVAPPSES
ncbi:MAG: alanine racemase [Microthrixaceae bacterium]